MSQSEDLAYQSTAVKSIEDLVETHFDIAAPPPPPLPPVLLGVLHEAFDLRTVRSRDSAKIIPSILRVILRSHV